MRERRSSGGKASRLAAFSWILYDFSNTIFSVTILSFYFPLWVEEQVGSGGLFSGAGLVNSATAVSALLVVLTAPVLGAVADLRQRRVPYLILLTIIAVALAAVASKSSEAPEGIGASSRSLRASVPMLGAAVRVCLACSRDFGQWALLN